jgi:hypothetical protein
VAILSMSSAYNKLLSHQKCFADSDFALFSDLFLCGPSY